MDSLTFQNVGGPLVSALSTKKILIGPVKVNYMSDSVGSE